MRGVQRTAYVLAFGFLIACGTLAGAPVPAGVWYVDSDPVPPVVSYRAVLFFEFVPTGAGQPAGDPYRGRALTITARCASCGAPDVQVTATPYASLAPEELYHAEATAGYTAAITLPRSGEWDIAPFGVTMTVRDVDSFEPPLVHANNWSGPFDPGCGRREVAALVNGFIDAYNAGDTKRLATLVQGSVNFSMAGARDRFVATDRGAFLEIASARHVAGDQLAVTRIQVSSIKGAIEMAIYGKRSAPDLAPAGQQFGAKAAMWCTQQQFIHLNIGVF